jgi:hypothetical protein
MTQEQYERWKDFALLRRMYPEGVPSWLTEQFLCPKTGRPVRFNRLGDKVPVWL